ncbi:hypothetical protein PTKIN_Ptkin11bG0105600 [Pterospermum kingtungense]
MSSTLFEVTRAAHEDVERLERLIVKDLQNEPSTGKDRLYQSHRVRNNIDTIMATTEKLIEIYEDKDNARKDEIAALGGQTATGINVFGAFYDRLKEIREYHRKHPAARVVDSNEEYEALLKEEPVIEFSGEEALGRYLDLHELFNQYIDCKFGFKIECSSYLDVFSQPHNIPWKLKSTRQYREYMENLLEYLIYFFQRTEPLQDLDRIFSKVEAEFEEQWADGQVQGWQKEGQAGGVGSGKVKGCIGSIRTKNWWYCPAACGEAFPHKAHTFGKAGRETFFKRKRHKLTLKVMKKISRFIILLNCQWVGMGSLYLTGFTSFMVLVRSLSEICGNYSYWGRRAFERHFKEWRHQHGMRCLGIPNTKNFNEITNIQEAQELWEKIRERQGLNKWRPDLEEEYEDKEGNIYNKKTYTDLQRQGLI